MLAVGGAISSVNHTANPVVVSETPDDHMSLRPLLALPVLCSRATTAATSGCVVVDNDNPPPPYDPYGDISFLWSFDGVTDCDLAGVDEVDIAVFQNGSLIDQIEREPCVGGGLTLIDYFEGQYEVEIDAYARNDALLYSGGFITRVVGGTTTNSGQKEKKLERPYTQRALGHPLRFARAVPLSSLRIPPR